jgi:hypothetical protein
MYDYLCLAEDFSKDKTNKIFDWLKDHKIYRQPKVAHSLNELYQFAKSSAEKKSKTIVAVGGDQVFSTIINAAKFASDKTTFGYLPVDRLDNTAKFIGVDSVESSLEAISARKVEEFDLVSIGKGYFLDKLDINIDMQDEKSGLEIIADRSFAASLSADKIILTNLLNQESNEINSSMIEAQTDPMQISQKKSFWNFKTKLKIKSEPEKILRLKAKQIRIIPNNCSFSSDNVLLSKTSPVIIGKNNTKINLIVKKHRLRHY